MVCDVFDSFEEKEEVFVDEGILSEFLAINYWVTHEILGNFKWGGFEIIFEVCLGG